MTAPTIDPAATASSARSTCSAPTTLLPVAPLHPPAPPLHPPHLNLTRSRRNTRLSPRRISPPRCPHFHYTFPQRHYGRPHYRGISRPVPARPLPTPSHTAAALPQTTCSVLELITEILTSSTLPLNLTLFSTQKRQEYRRPICLAPRIRAKLEYGTHLVETRCVQTREFVE